MLEGIPLTPVKDALLRVDVALLDLHHIVGLAGLVEDLLQGNRNIMHRHITKAINTHNQHLQMQRPRFTWPLTKNTTAAIKIMATTAATKIMATLAGSRQELSYRHQTTHISRKQVVSLSTILHQGLLQARHETDLHMLKTSAWLWLS